jgi:hypothetical protein
VFDSAFCIYFICKFELKLTILFSIYPGYITSDLLYTSIPCLRKEASPVQSKDLLPAKAHNQDDVRFIHRIHNHRLAHIVTLNFNPIQVVANVDVIRIHTFPEVITPKYPLVDISARNSSGP